MASSINAATAGGGGIITSADSSGTLLLQTVGITALTLDNLQNVTYSSTTGVFSIQLQAVLGDNLVQNNTLQLYQGHPGYDAFLTFHCAGAYAGNFGLDHLTNRLFWGGWSNGAIKKIIWDSGSDNTTSGQIKSTQANDTAAGGAQIFLNGATGNRIDFAAAGIAPPSFTTRSLGTRICLYPGVSATMVDYAIGIDGSTFWSSIPDTSHLFKWYGGTTLAASLSGSGNLSVTGSLNCNAANDATTGGGQIYLNGANGNRIDFSAVGLGYPTFTTRSAGTKIVLYPQVGAAAVDYAIGIHTTGILWNSVPNTTLSFKWFGGISEAMTLSGTGILDTEGPIRAAIGSGYGQFIATAGSASTWYGAIFRNDGTNVCLLSTAVQTTEAAAKTAIYNSFRPFYWVLATGAVAINSSATGTTSIDGTSIGLNSNTTVTGTFTTTGGAVSINASATGNTSIDGAAIYLNSNSYVTGVLDVTSTITGGDFHTDRGNNTGYIYLGNANTSYMGFNGTSLGGTSAYTVLSDERVKSNIQPIYNSLEKVLQLNAKSYIRNLTQKEEIGIIAQELMKVIPTAVSKAEGETSLDANGVAQLNYYSVDYNQITALLIEGVKEQQQIIDELTKKIQLLESR